MLFIPVPIFFAVILAFLALRAFWAGRHLLLVVFLGACALQTFAAASAMSYDIKLLQTILPVTASTIPTLAWLTFRAALFKPCARSDAVPHLLVPLFCLFCKAFAPETIDVVLPLIFAGYGTAILFNLRALKDLPLARLEAGGTPKRLWQLLGWLLIVSAISEILITAAYLSGSPIWADRIFSIFASGIILLLGIVSSLPDANGAATSKTPQPNDGPTDATVTLHDKDILAKLETLLAREKIFLDANLTVSRLARRLHIPEKQLSASVNRATGANVSRYINTWRIKHACDRMIAGESVTDAMLGSGFNTKSNFNREFLRLMNTNPSAWIKQQSHADQKLPNQAFDVT